MASLFHGQRVYASIAISITIILCLSSVLLCSCPQRQLDSNKIRLGYLQSDLHHLPAFIALEKNYFKEEGLVVEMAGAFKAGPELMSAFPAHALDVAYVGLSPALTALANGSAKIKFIAQVNQEGSAIVVKDNAACNKVADLQGRVVTIPGHATMQDFLLRKALKYADIPFNKIKLLVLKPPEMIPALNQGDIDAFIVWEPYPAKAITSRSGKVVMTSHDIWPNHPCCVMIAADDYLRKHPDSIKKLQKVHKHACDFIANNREESIDIGVKYTGMDRNTVVAALSAMVFDGELKKEDVMEFVKFLKELQYIKNELSQNDLIQNFIP